RHPRLLAAIRGRHQYAAAGGLLGDAVLRQTSPDQVALRPLRDGERAQPPVPDRPHPRPADRRPALVSRRTALGRPAPPVTRVSGGTAVMVPGSAAGPFPAKQNLFSR